MQEKIREGFDVFVHDGEKAFGAVRRIHAHELVIYVEAAGDFAVPFSAIQDVHDEKVVLDGAKLDAKLRSAISHAHDGERPGFPEDRA